MKVAGSFASLCILLVATGAASGARQLLQSPPPSFNVPPELATPTPTVLAFPWKAVGTQNFTADPGAPFKSAGAVADFFKESGPPVVGKFFFQNIDGALSPVFTKIDPTTGQQTGVCSGKVTARSKSPAKQTNDGNAGGSVDNVLYTITAASGSLANITFVQRVGAKGGFPGQLTGLDVFSGVPNFDLALPYQADYLFLQAPPSGAQQPPSPASPSNNAQNPCFCQDKDGSGFCFNFAGSSTNAQCNPTGRTGCNLSQATDGQFTTKAGPVFKCNPAGTSGR